MLSTILQFDFVTLLWNVLKSLNMSSKQARFGNYLNFMINILSCPNCKSVLKNESNAYRCANGHSFDRAKQGYVNLLLSNHKKTSDPGDNKNMILAREEFLSLGHYDFLIDQISKNIDESLEDSKGEKSVLLDLGCGSGYYTRSLSEKNKELVKVGVDISKNAVSIAAKNDKLSTYAVGSAFRLPVVDDAADIVLNVFSPLDLTEIIRVLKMDGYLVKVIPGPDHMKEIAELVYENFKAHSTTIIDEIENDVRLNLIATQSVDKRILFNVADLKQLINMTPYKYKFNEEALNSLTEMSVTISFIIVKVQLKATSL